MNSPHERANRIGNDAAQLAAELEAVGRNLRAIQDDLTRTQQERAQAKEALVLCHERAGHAIQVAERYRAELEWIVGLGSAVDDAAEVIHTGPLHDVLNELAARLRELRELLKAEKGLAETSGG